MITPPHTTETLLIAGPPPPNPPAVVAALIILMGLVAPVLFLRNGTPSLWLTAAIFALACAGVMTLVGVKNSIAKNRADAAIRPRAAISSEGIIFLSSPARPENQSFPAEHIEHVTLFGNALMVKTTNGHVSPGRHILRFSQLASPRDDLSRAILTLAKTA